MCSAPEHHFPTLQPRVFLKSLFSAGLEVTIEQALNFPGKNQGRRSQAGLLRPFSFRDVDPLAMSQDAAIKRRQLKARRANALVGTASPLSLA